MESLTSVLLAAESASDFGRELLGLGPHLLTASLFLCGAVIVLPLLGVLLRDRRLVLGSLVFGIGWGLAGYCPGPVITSLAVGGSKPWIFFLAMLAGMAIFELLERKRS